MLPDEAVYHKADTKMMIVGQETNDWEGIFGRHSIESLQYVYKNFMIEDSYSVKSTFWRYMQNWSKLIETGTPNGTASIVWNNIYKMGRVSEIGKPNNKIQLITKKHFNVFEEELKILKPDIVLFLTGPNYDNALQSFLPEIKLHKIEEGAERQIVRCKHQALPKLAYRTYHPGYLNRLTPGNKPFHRETPIEVILREMKR